MSVVSQTLSLNQINNPRDLRFTLIAETMLDTSLKDGVVQMIFSKHAVPGGWSSRVGEEILMGV